MTTTGMLCKEGWEIVVLHELSQMVWPVSPEIIQFFSLLLLCELQCCCKGSYYFASLFVKFDVYLSKYVSQHPLSQ